MVKPLMAFLGAIIPLLGGVVGLVWFLNRLTANTGTSAIILILVAGVALAGGFALPRIRLGLLSIFAFFGLLAFFWLLTVLTNDPVIAIILFILAILPALGIFSFSAWQRFQAARKASREPVQKEPITPAAEEKVEHV